MEVLKNVLIKEIDGGRNGDKVFYVDNLPKSLLYTKAIKRVLDPDSPTGDRLVPEYTIKDGLRVPTGAMVDELHPGIEMSQNGDGAYCFFTMLLEAQYRLKDIDNYIQANVPVAERVPVREYYAAQPGHMNSQPRPLHTLPRVVLPEPVSPPAKAEQTSGTPSVASDVSVKTRKPRKPMTEEQKNAARERLAKARAIKAAAVAQEPAN